MPSPSKTFNDKSWCYVEVYAAYIVEHADFKFTNEHGDRWYAYVSDGSGELERGQLYLTGSDTSAQSGGWDVLATRAVAEIEGSEKPPLVLKESEALWLWSCILSAKARAT